MLEDDSGRPGSRAGVGAHGLLELATETPRLRVIELGGGWGLGGTEQAVEVRAALLDRAAFDVLVVGLWGGPRYDRLVTRGVRATELEGQLGRLADVLATFRPALLHYVRSERDCAYSRTVQELCAKAGVPVVVETNVFGRPPAFREAKPPAITGHMSLASMQRQAGQTGTDMRALYERGHRAVYLPVPTPDGFGAPELPPRDVARAALGIDADAFVCCRVARPDLRKWSTRLELALPELFERVPRLRFLFMAAPPEKAALLTRRFGRRVLCVEPTLELESIARVHAASDLMVHSSGIGESFGLAVAEGMFHGLPVVTDTTPTLDNAQVEVVGHGQGGLIVTSARGFAYAVKALAADATLRASLSRGAQQRAAGRFADRVVVAHWQRLYAAACRGAGLALPESLAGAADDSLERYLAFSTWYADALGQTVGPDAGLEERVVGKVRRARDTLAYAGKLGPEGVLRVLRSRLRSSRSLSRD